jgi:hypothetical protein
VQQFVRYLLLVPTYPGTKIDGITGIMKEYGEINYSLLADSLTEFKLLRYEISDKSRSYNSF